MSFFCKQNRFGLPGRLKPSQLSGRLAEHPPHIRSGERAPALSKFLRPAINFSSLKNEFESAEPFRNVVIDDFLLPEVARKISEEFPGPDDQPWFEYNNALEIKKALNHWDRFPKATYELFDYLNSNEFVAEMTNLAGVPLFADHGLHGAGWHTHAPGGKLNTHLDYSIHPKLGKERVLNLIIYVTPGWKENWGGELGFWEDSGSRPGELKKRISPFFNRAVLFDTSQKSWHGLPDPVLSPAGIARNSLAVYYMCEPRQSAADRSRSLYAPYGAQSDDPRVLDLIKRRSHVETSQSAYRDGK
jgi:Rps23 Pro-64 3,4-dihydroxylase Tpa1-like proline 4-hydroxylase